MNAIIPTNINDNGNTLLEAVPLSTITGYSFNIDSLPRIRLLSPNWPNTIHITHVNTHWYHVTKIGAGILTLSEDNNI